MNIKPVILLVFIVNFFSCHSITKKTISEKQITTDTSPTIYIDEPIGYKPSEDSTLKNSLTKQNKSTNIKLVFPGFIMSFNNFWVPGDSNDDGKFRYEGDTSEAKLDVDDNNVETLTVKTDTLHLSFNGNTNLDNNPIEIIPKNKSDRFQVSYSFKISIHKFVSANNTALWESMAPYKRIKDSLNYFFNMPLTVNSDADIKKIKENLNLRDTTHKYDDGDYGEQTATDVIYRNKLCIISDSGVIYFKIDRFNGNKLKESKVLAVAFDDQE